MVVIILGTGYLASAYSRALIYLGYSPLILSREWLDYTCRDRIRGVITTAKPQWIINCSGFTGTSVDECESKRIECEIANAVVPRILAEESDRGKCGFIHISSGCIFSGLGPFTEEDEPNFVTNHYQQTKIRGEQNVWLRHPSPFIFRIRMPFSETINRKNWLVKLCKYACNNAPIIDGMNSVTWVDEFAMRSWQLAQKAKPGVYHAVQPQPVSTLSTAQHATLLVGVPKARLATAELLEQFYLSHIPRSGAVLSCKKFDDAYGTAGTPAPSAIEHCLKAIKVELRQRTHGAYAPGVSPCLPTYWP